MNYRDELETFLQTLKEQTAGQEEFHQAVEEIFSDIFPFVDQQGKMEDYRRHNLFERLVMPDRTIHFRVTWQDDEGDLRSNRGWRVQFNNVLGPYKGGLRFHPSVETGTFKFLGFEQVFKNALTGLSLGGAKGGSDFDPKGKSNGEIARFCQSFMMELYKYIGPDRDIPAGDIGVGEREIGYLFGTYKKLTDQFHGTLTGKDPLWGGSNVRQQATGYGAVYFLEAILKHRDDNLEGKRCLISGAGNVALHTAEKLIARGADVLTVSDSDGLLVCPSGFSCEQIQEIKALKFKEYGRLHEYNSNNTEYHDGQTPWHLEADIAVPAATQNEIDKEAAQKLCDNGIAAVIEGANMPLTKAATNLLREQQVAIAPGKAANAGGVAVSQFEMAQNAQKIAWEFDRIDSDLQHLMHRIHDQCAEYGETEDTVDYIKGANIASFIRISQAMMDQIV